jgi:hypothetical protein
MTELLYCGDEKQEDAIMANKNNFEEFYCF